MKGYNDKIVELVDEYKNIQHSCCWLSMGMRLIREKITYHTTNRNSGGNMEMK